MVVVHRRPKRTKTGSRYKDARRKRLFETGREPTHTKVGERKVKKIRGRGGTTKDILLNDEYVNVADPKNKKVKKVKITDVLENPANRHYVRRKILTKGAVINTELGKARITSRPGQEGTVNAVLVE